MKAERIFFRTAVDGFALTTSLTTVEFTSGGTTFTELTVGAKRLQTLLFRMQPTGAAINEIVVEGKLHPDDTVWTALPSASLTAVADGVSGTLTVPVTGYDQVRLRLKAAGACTAVVYLGGTDQLPFDPDLATLTNGSNADSLHTHANLPTADEKAALVGMNAPSASNPYATKATIDSRFAKPAGMARMVSVKTAGNIVIKAKSSTGYIAARAWDGAITIVGAGSSTVRYVINLAVPASGAWSDSAPKEIFVWSCTGSADATQSGNLTYLSCYSNSLTVSGLTALTYLSCIANSLTALDVSSLTALTELSCNSNALTVLDVSGLTALTTLYCDSNNLTSIRATGVILSYGYPSVYYGSNLEDNDLDAAALDQFYTDLGVDVGANGVLMVGGNPGTTSDDPDIATAKGYTVAGS